MSEPPKEVVAKAMVALMVPEHEMVGSVANAILVEREQCAKIADRWKHTDEGYAIAAAIRKETE